MAIVVFSESTQHLQGFVVRAPGAVYRFPAIHQAFLDQALPPRDESLFPLGSPIPLA